MLQPLSGKTCSLRGLACSFDNELIGLPLSPWNNRRSRTDTRSRRAGSEQGAHVKPRPMIFGYVTWSETNLSGSEQAELVRSVNAIGIRAHVRQFYKNHVGTLLWHAVVFGGALLWIAIRDPEILESVLV